LLHPISLGRFRCRKKQESNWDLPSQRFASSRAFSHRRAAPCFSLKHENPTRVWCISSLPHPCLCLYFFPPPQKVEVVPLQFVLFLLLCSSAAYFRGRSLPQGESFFDIESTPTRSSLGNLAPTPASCEVVCKRIRDCGLSSQAAAKDGPT